MALLTPAQAWKLLDQIGSLYKSIYGSSTYGAGDGTFGASYKVETLMGLVTAGTDSSFADSDIQTTLIPSAAKLRTLLHVDNQFAAVSDFIFTLSGICARAVTVDTTIGSLDTYLYWYNYLNAVSYWQCMAPPEFRDAYYACYRSYPNLLNVYFPITEGGVWRGTTYTNALAKRVIGTSTTTLGATVNRTKYAGGFCYAQWTGGAGSGACTITVTGKDQNGNNETWTLAGTWSDANFVASQAGVALNPGTSHSLITEVLTVATTGMTTGTMFIESRPPTGRSWPI